MLNNNTQPEDIEQRLSENEKLVKEMSLTKHEKLAKTELKQEENRQALISLGLASGSAGSEERSKYFLVNLNADPSLNELLVYYLSRETRVGSPSSTRCQDIQLTGVGIQDEHCILTIEDDSLFLEPVAGARTLVNGKQATSKILVRDGDRILWGSNHFFRVNYPGQGWEIIKKNLLYSFKLIFMEFILLS